MARLHEVGLADHLPVQREYNADIHAAVEVINTLGKIKFVQPERLCPLDRGEAGNLVPGHGPVRGPDGSDR